MYSYSGELDVDGGEFILDADRFVIKEGAIEFMLSGSDGDGDFTVDGTAILTGGIYIASQVKVDYLGYFKNYYATIHFDYIAQTPKKQSCKVKGKWFELGNSWTFSGSLRKFKLNN